ncbi:unnamed protein product [Oppiella nova]|uniref:Uncharacterized protein n=1 Tax=Oppiella nova TaxID=334625 RepID=A0A7R9M9M0_9ACAR|nr:unnamed protein product [Oppiella nova]CAG2172213.1 unnamed protein product [Oppiella nova]
MDSNFEDCLKEKLGKNKEIIKKLNEIRSTMKTHHMVCNGFKTAGTGVSAAGTVILTVSILAIPLTGGLSLLGGGWGHNIPQDEAILRVFHGIAKGTVNRLKNPKKLIMTTLVTLAIAKVTFKEITKVYVNGVLVSTSVRTFAQVAKFIGKATVVLSVLTTAADIGFLIRDWVSTHPSIKMIDDLKRQINDESKSLEAMYNLIEQLKDSKEVAKKGTSSISTVSVTATTSGNKSTSASGKGSEGTGSTGVNGGNGGDDERGSSWKNPGYDGDPTYENKISTSNARLIQVRRQRAEIEKMLSQNGVENPRRLLREITEYARELNDIVHSSVHFPNLQNESQRERDETENQYFYNVNVAETLGWSQSDIPRIPSDSPTHDEYYRNNNVICVIQDTDGQNHRGYSLRLARALGEIRRQVTLNMDKMEIPLDFDDEFDDQSE